MEGRVTTLCAVEPPAGQRPPVAAGDVTARSMRRFSIGTRLIVFSSALLGVLIATNLYLITELVSRSGTVVAATELLAHLERATAAATAFGDIKYWLTGPRGQPAGAGRGKAGKARRAARWPLDGLAPYDPGAVAAIRAEADVRPAGAGGGRGARQRPSRPRGPVAPDPPRPVRRLFAQARAHSAAVDELGALRGAAPPAGRRGPRPRAGRRRQRAALGRPHHGGCDPVRPRPDRPHAALDQPAPAPPERGHARDHGRRPRGPDPAVGARRDRGYGAPWPCFAIA